jgi:hypothetical protein
MTIYRHFEPVGSAPVTMRCRVNKPMKLLAIITALACASCVETTVTAPDGTVTKTKAPAPGSLELAGEAIRVLGEK